MSRSLQGLFPAQRETQSSKSLNMFLDDQKIVTFLHRISASNVAQWRETSFHGLLRWDLEGGALIDFHSRGRQRETQSWLSSCSHAHIVQLKTETKESYLVTDNQTQQSFLMVFADDGRSLVNNEHYCTGYLWFIILSTLSCVIIWDVQTVSKAFVMKAD